MESITTKIFLAIAFFVELAFALNGASANFIYDYGRMYGVEIHGSKMDFNAKFFSQNPLVFDWEPISIESDGGEAVLLSAAFPFDVGSFVLEPSFLFASGNWQRGDFYYFYGKPDLPAVLGFSTCFYHYSNVFGVNYILGNAKLLNNNESSELFNSDFYFYNAFYKFGAIKNANLYAGFAGLNIEARGALTAANQAYALFPYEFFNASGHLHAKVAYTFMDLKLESDVAEYGMNFGVITALGGKIRGNMHYKNRKFFGKDEFIEDLNPVQLKNSGIIFSVLSLKTKKMSLGGNFIQYGVQKPIAIPFGDIFPSVDFNGDISLLKDALLFGLTANISIFF